MSDEQQEELKPTLDALAGEWSEMQTEDERERAGHVRPISKTVTTVTSATRMRIARGATLARVAKSKQSLSVRVKRCARFAARSSKRCLPSTVRASCALMSIGMRMSSTWHTPKVTATKRPPGGFLLLIGT